MRHSQYLLSIGLAGSVWAIAIVAWADEVSAPLHLSFRKALELSQTRHVDVIVENERVQQAMARLGQAGSVLLPQVSASASQTRQTKNLEASGITLPGRDPLVGPFNSFDARVRVTQTLLDIGAIQRLRAAHAGKALSLAEYQKIKQDILSLIASLFVEAERAAQGLELAHAVLSRDDARLRIAAAQQELGTGSLLEVRQAQAAYTQSLYRWRAAVAQATSTRTPGWSPREG